MRRRIPAIFSTILLVLLPVIGACEDDSEERERIVINIEGTWELEASLDQDQGDLLCELTGLTLTIEMQGNTQLFGGQGLGGVASCSGGEGSLEVQLPTLTVFNGVQEGGTEVRFTLADGTEEADNFLAFEGDMTGTRMEGQVQGFILLDDAAPQATAFVGTFVLRRTST